MASYSHSDIYRRRSRRNVQVGPRRTRIETGIPLRRHDERSTGIAGCPCRGLSDIVLRRTLLLNGQPPIPVYARVIAKPFIRVHSIDGEKSSPVRTAEGPGQVLRVQRECRGPRCQCLLTGISAFNHGRWDSGDFGLPASRLSRQARTPHHRTGMVSCRSAGTKAMPAGTNRTGGSSPSCDLC